MHSDDKKRLDGIDAMVHSSDTLLFRKDREEFKQYLASWQRRIEEIEADPELQMEDEP